MPVTEPRTQHRLGRSLASRRDLQRFAARVRKQRLHFGLSQGKLADAVGVSLNQISNIERAANWPAMPVCLKLCRLLGIELPKAVDETA